MYLLRKIVPTNFFTWMQSVFRLNGLDPPKRYPHKILYLLLALPHLFCCTALFFILGWIGFFMYKVSIKKKTFSFSNNLLHTIVCIRIIFWYFNRNNLNKITAVVNRKTFSFECFKVIKINSEILRKKCSKNDECKSPWKNVGLAISKNKNPDDFREAYMFRTRKRCLLLYVTVSATCLFTNILFNLKEILLSQPHNAFNERINDTSVYRDLPFLLYFPFDISVSNGYYWLALAFEQYSYLGSLYLYLPVDTIVTISIIHLISQVIIVGKAFEYVDKNIDADQPELNKMKIREIRIVKCINELQHVYRAMNMIEQLYSVQLLIQYGSAVFLFCSLLSIVPLINTVVDYVYVACFLSASLGEMFLFTYCCQTLSLELQNLSDKVYNLEWRCYPVGLRRSLVFQLKVLQKRKIFTAGKIIDLDLLFFIKVVQRSYSFYTIMSKTTKY